MASTHVLHHSIPKEADDRDAAPRGLSVWAGVLWVIALAAAWNVVLVLFHNLMDRLLY